MGKISVQALDQFKEHDDKVVLVSMDREGLDLLRAHLARMPQDSPAISRFVHAELTHVFAIGGDVARLDVAPKRVTWRLPAPRLKELKQRLHGLGASEKPAHDFMEISGDAETLVLSVDEGY